MKHFTLLFLFYLLFLMIVNPAHAHEFKSAGVSVISARLVGDDGWKVLSPPGAGFEILFPEEPKEGTALEGIGGWYLKAHEYSFGSEPRFAVNYFDAPRIVSGVDNPAALVENFRIDTLMRLHGDILSKRKEIALAGYPGHSLEVPVGNAGVTKIALYAVGRRLYRVSVLMLNKSAFKEGSPEQAAATKFFDSFKLLPGEVTAGEGNLIIGATSEAAPDVEGLRAPVSGGVLSGKARQMGQPEYPPIAKAARVSGAVIVQVLVSEQGEVIAVKAISGHPLLQQAAMRAALQTSFEPTLLQGQPVKVSGTLTFNFVLK